MFFFSLQTPSSPSDRQQVVFDDEDYDIVMSTSSPVTERTGAETTTDQPPEAGMLTSPATVAQPPPTSTSDQPSEAGPRGSKSIRQELPLQNLSNGKLL